MLICSDELDGYRLHAKATLIRTCSRGRVRAIRRGYRRRPGRGRYLVSPVGPSVYPPRGHVDGGFESRRDAVRLIGNLLWLILGGLVLALGYAVAGVIMFVFVITIPFGIQAVKLASFSLWPSAGSSLPDREKAR
jgi:hypothetical protein